MKKKIDWKKIGVIILIITMIATTIVGSLAFLL